MQTMLRCSTQHLLLPLGALLLCGCMESNSGQNVQNGGRYVPFGYTTPDIPPCIDHDVDDGAADEVVDVTQADSGQPSGGAQDVSQGVADVVVTDVKTSSTDTGSNVQDAASADAVGQDSGPVGGKDISVLDGVASVDSKKGPPTFAGIYSQVIAKYGCTAPKCHGAEAQDMAIFISVKSAYDLIVNKASKVKDCQFLPIVLPGKPENSVLYTKIKDGVKTCGGKMPVGTDGLPDAAAALVYDWIKAGAPK